MSLKISHIEWRSLNGGQTNQAWFLDQQHETSSINITQDLVRNANSRPPLRATKSQTEGWEDGRMGRDRRLGPGNVF